ncbi:glycosyltransferase family 1 protein [Cellulomonas fimi]|uniref:Glycosyltransferase family 4 protein n=1 Tax=Cellulomonas fimi TaxID=1708 RepID=A0A7Y0QH83_CELFI|nr:glycosyltransferase family 1 protein [Cellulomonas fimi]NMR20866.1 glycosyltransferase family 4 protein [Cellulomonas fimi]
MKVVAPLRARGAQVVEALVAQSPRHRAALVDRLQTLLRTLGAGGARPTEQVDDLVEQVAARLDPHDADTMWLALAVIAAELPTAVSVVAARRRAELEGPATVLRDAIGDVAPANRTRRVEVATDEVLVDVNHLARTTLTTGIQRVTHATVTRWHRDHELSFVVWTHDRRALRRLTAAETTDMLTGAPRRSSAAPELPTSVPTVVVPWRCRYVLPEVALEMSRTRRTLALVMHARCATGVIGFDAVPLTTSETTEQDVPAQFINELAAIRHMDRVATISLAAETEYRGWRTMVSAAGITGPSIRTIALPSSVEAPDATALAATRARFCLPTMPMVLCVGSHEPRKNHLAVLHAAELLWRRGRKFSLVFVGGNAWNSERTQQRLAELTEQGRPVESVRALPDETLFALYRLARCTVFPSLNEGFGLPVAESLASGTPVVTSRFGAMAEVGESGGTLLVDPRDDHSIAVALDTLLTDDHVHARLAREAAERPVRTWDEYAAETWDYLVTSNPMDADA